MALRTCISPPIHETFIKASHVTCICDLNRQLSTHKDWDDSNLISPPMLLWSPALFHHCSKGFLITLVTSSFNYSVFNHCLLKLGFVHLFQLGTEKCKKITNAWGFHTEQIFCYLRLTWGKMAKPVKPCFWILLLLCPLREPSSCTGGCIWPRAAARTLTIQLRLRCACFNVLHEDRHMNRC